MPVPPVIPTSFVPHPSSGASSGTARSANSSSFAFGSILSTLAYLFLVLALLSAGGVFIYDKILVSEQTSKDAQLATAVASLNQTTIDQFIRLSNRFTSAKTLLDSHVALSGLFNLLSTITPANVSFSTLSVSIDDAGNATLQAGGTAKSFNTLAVASTAFGTDTQLKDVIFSNLAIGSSGTVGFSLSATLNPTLIAYTGMESVATTTSAGFPTAPPPISTATTTASTTP